MGGRSARTLEVGKAAPAFKLSATNGKKYALAEGLASGPLLVAFFKVSCPTCQFTFPFIERLHQQLRSACADGARVWGISQDNANYSGRFAKEFGVTFPILIDEEPHEISQEYGLNYVPTLFLISPDGQVEITCDGFSKAGIEDIHRSLAKHSSVKPPALFKTADRVPEFKPG